MYSANLKKRLDNTRRKRLRCTSESTLRNLSASGRFCDSLVLKSMKRSVINIGRSMFDVQSVHCSGHDARKKQPL
jgi:hypothetical protein